MGKNVTIPYVDTIKSHPEVSQRSIAVGEPEPAHQPAPSVSSVKDSRGNDVGSGRDVMTDEEKYTRLGVGLAHTIGGTILTAFGGGSYVPAIGQLEQSSLDMGFKKSPA